MFGFFKKKTSKIKTPPAPPKDYSAKIKAREAATYQAPKQGYRFTWHEVGEGNPLNKRILDIRDFTQNNLSLTKDISVAEMYNKQRLSTGQELVGTKMAGSKTISVNLVYRHNGSKLEGVTYKAKCMEDKWDIYIWNDIIYFTRSWTGEVAYKAAINVTDTNVSVYEIEYVPTTDPEDSMLAENNVHFLIMTLALGAVYPHKVPKSLTTDRDIALYSFNQFGHNCWYATFDEILDTVVNRKEA